MSDQINVTVAAPLAHVADASQLARCVGYSVDDERTFSGPDWRDGEGNLYRVTSGPVWPAFLAVPGQALAEPEWGADLAAANRAQALLVVTLPGEEVQPVDPEHISAVVGLDGVTAAQMLGLSPVVAASAD